MIYLNHAATSYPKPKSVIKAVTEKLTSAPQSALRSNLSADEDLLADLRRRLGTLFHITDYERIFFCSSATDAINRVLGGISVAGIRPSRDSHNSVLRPVANGIRQIPVIQSSRLDTIPYLEVVNHCSNVTGKINKVRKGDSLLMLDASQSAGCIPIDVDGWGVDILVFTGHKSLFGPTGTGGYYVRRGIRLRPTQYGGTGRDSSVIRYQDGDWEYEVGTPNIVGLAGLRAGVRYVMKRGVATIFSRLQSQTQWLIDTLRTIGKVTLYSEGGPQQGPVVSFNIDGLQPSDVGYILQNTYDITVRTGLHCSPLIHHDLGTYPHGTVRVSLSDFTTEEELASLVKAVRAIASSL